MIQLKKFNLLVFIATLAALVTGFFFNEVPFVHLMVDEVSKATLGALKLVSVPLIFFSILSTIEYFKEGDIFGKIIRPTVFYTILTTILATLVALASYLIISPNRVILNNVASLDNGLKSMDSFSLSTFIIPDNMFRPFVEGNIFSVLLITLLIYYGTIKVERSKREFLANLFSSIFAVLIKIVGLITYILPVAIWAFVSQIIFDIRDDNYEITPVLYYFAAVILSNIFHATMTLPTLLKIKGISPIKLVKKMAPALFLGFVSRSSSATLPVTMDSAEKAGVNPLIARLTLPLCATVNMNACAAFIFTTVTFVLEQNLVVMTPLSYLAIMGISIIAAIGNAAVPMGCYLMASTILSSTGASLNILGVILPIYTFIDMMETCFNIWSDSSITAIIDKEVKLGNDIL